MARDETAVGDAIEPVEAEIWFWARSSELASGLEDELGRAVADWLARDWPFRRVLWQGAARKVVRAAPPAASPVSPVSAESAL